MPQPFFLRNVKIDADADQELLRLARATGARYSVIANAAIRYALAELAAGRQTITVTPTAYTARLHDAGSAPANGHGQQPDAGRTRPRQPQEAPEP